MSKGLFELRLKSQEGIARVMYCTLVGKRIGLCCIKILKIELS
ncbi:type II toxin-antitoxin system RelE/ParE family toxin [Acinetobacter pittii]|nr:type II toxin-antitoxin system RelE/ParE family toxin [Acinetobacter pittii]